MEHGHFEQFYKDYQISGSAESVHNDSESWFAIARVTLRHPNNSLTEVDRFQDREITADDETLAAWFDLGLAEIAVDHLIPFPRVLLTPMNLAWAVDLMRRGAEECKERKIRRAKLYEALDFLEKNTDARAPVENYRRALRGDRPDEWQKDELRQILIAAALGIQRSASALLVKLMNELAFRFRDNKPKIARLRQMLDIVRRPVRS